MSASLETRRVQITARAASDLTSSAVLGQNTPYLEISLGDSTVTTNAAENAPENPVWDETFEITLPPATSDEKFVLHVLAKNKTAVPMMPDTVIGNGSFPLSTLFSTGTEEARIPLSSVGGKPAGVAFVGMKIMKPTEEQEIRTFNVFS